MQLNGRILVLFIASPKHPADFLFDAIFSYDINEMAFCSRFGHYCARNCCLTRPANSGSDICFLASIICQASSPAVYLMSGLSLVTTFNITFATSVTNRGVLIDCFRSEVIVTTHKF
jgi:hypothetical protein